MIDPQTERLVCEAYIAGERKVDIAERLGVSRQTVINVAFRNNLPYRKDSGPSPAKIARNEGICEAWAAGRTAVDIADEFGVHESTVYVVANKAGLPRRRRDHFTEEFKATICAAFLTGEPTASIGERLGISQGAVSSVAMRAGLPPRRRHTHRSPSDPERDKLVCEAYIAGENTISLAKRLGIAQCTVSHIARRNGIPLRRRRGSVDLERDKLACEAYAAGELLRSIAERLGVSPGHVSRVAKRNGLTMRGRNHKINR